MRDEDRGESSTIGARVNLGGIQLSLLDVLAPFASCYQVEDDSVKICWRVFGGWREDRKRLAAGVRRAGRCTFGRQRTLLELELAGVDGERDES